MPQIWLTYDELGAFLGCSPERARADAAENGSGRRRCHDGLTRVKLRPATAVAFVEGLAAARDRQEIARLRQRVRELEALLRQDPVGAMQARLGLEFARPAAAPAAAEGASPMPDRDAA
jgi:hypothetical protein